MPHDVLSSDAWRGRARAFWHGLIRLEARRARRRRRRAERDVRLTRQLAEAFGPTVQSGPFQGLRYAFLEAEGSVLAPKLLGTYECELHGWIEALVGTGYRRVVVVGCAEGYYAVGLARRLPAAQVFAFDLSARARALCADLAEANGVADRLVLGGRCERADLDRLVEPGTLVVCDCEGAEFDLLCPAEMPSLREGDFLVEVHRTSDVADPATTMEERFAATHAVQRATYGTCPRTEAAALAALAPSDRAFAVDENRSSGMAWVQMLRR